MPTLTATWPEDADGDVFRRLVENSFDFTKSHVVDYNVDFQSWPPLQVALTKLESAVGSIVLHPPGDDLGGYVSFTVSGPLTYEGVISTQRRVSALMEPFGGICESWGVVQDAL